MARNSVTFILLLFELTIVFGFSITKIQQRSSEPTEVINQTDVYEVREGDRPTVRIVHPKADKPTLREIIYYRVIETPYDNQKSNDDDGPDFDDTRRPFTNSHGLPFISDDNDVKVVSKAVQEKKEGRIEDNKEAIDTRAIADTEADELIEETTEQLEEESYTTTEEPVYELIAKENAEVNTEVTPTITEELVVFGDETTIAADETTSIADETTSIADETTSIADETTSIADETTTIADETTTIADETTIVASETEVPDIEVTTPRRDDVEEEKKHARNLLFSQVKNKYQNIVRKPAIAPSRQKRETKLEHIPEAPVLPKLNIDALPEYVRKLIPTPKPAIPTPFKEHVETEESSEEDFEEDLEHKIDEMITSAMPDDEDDGDDDDDDDEEDYEIEEEKVKRVPRTYGMNLTADRGYVWNDLWSKPGMAFDIKDSESDEEDRKEIATDLPEKVEIEPLEHKLHPAESRPFINENEVIEESKHDSAHNHEMNPDEKDIERPDQLEIGPLEHKFHPAESKPFINENNGIEDAKHDEEDIEIPKRPKSLLIDEDKDSDELEHEENNDSDTKIEDKKHSKKENTSSKLELEKETDTTKPPKEKMAIDDQPEKPLQSTKLKKDESKKKLKNKKLNKDVKKDEDILKKAELPASTPDVMKDLLQNEEFWKWAGEWMSSYLELMMKHIKKFVHDEVSRQVKSYAKKKDTPLEDMKEASGETPKKNREKKPHEKHSKEKENKGSKQKDRHEKADEKNITKNNEPDITEPKATDNKLIIDGKEIPITHNTNFKIEDVKNSENDSLKRKKDKDDNKVYFTPNKLKPDKKKRKGNLPVSISASNIFGNSVGSDKVTNVFVFYPTEEEKSDIIDDIKPIVNGPDNIFSFGNNEIAKNKDQELTGHKDESTMTEHTTPSKPIESLKEPEDKIDIGKGEGKDHINTDKEHIKDKDTHTENLDSSKHIDEANKNNDTNIIHDKAEAQKAEHEITDKASNEKPMENKNKDKAKPEDGKKDENNKPSTETSNDNPIEKNKEKTENQRIENGNTDDNKKSSSTEASNEKPIEKNREKAETKESEDGIIDENKKSSSTEESNAKTIEKNNEDKKEKTKPEDEKKDEIKKSSSTETSNEKLTENNNEEKTEKQDEHGNDNKNSSSTEATKEKPIVNINEHKEDIEKPDDEISEDNKVSTTTEANKDQDKEVKAETEKPDTIEKKTTDDSKIESNEKKDLEKDKSIKEDKSAESKNDAKDSDKVE